MPSPTPASLTTKTKSGSLRSTTSEHLRARVPARGLSRIRLAPYTSWSFLTTFQTGDPGGTAGRHAGVSGAAYILSAVRRAIIDDDDLEVQFAAHGEGELGRTQKTGPVIKAKTNLSVNDLTSSHMM